MSIGKNIRKIRELKDIRREYVANKLGISLSAYGKIERGVTKIDADHERSQKIAEILGVPKNTLEHFSEDISIHKVKESKVPIIPKSKSGKNANKNELISLHKQTLKILKKVTAILQKISQDETKGDSLII